MMNEVDILEVARRATTNPESLTIEEIQLLGLACLEDIAEPIKATMQDESNN